MSPSLPLKACLPCLALAMALSGCATTGRYAGDDTGPEPRYFLILGEPEAFSDTYPPSAPSAPRQIGFATVLYTLKTPREALAEQVNAALDKAEGTGYPVFFHLDDWNFPDTWDNPAMVEWTGFPEPGEAYGPPVRRRWLNWGSWIVTPPPPNFESPAFRALLRDRVANGVATPVAERLRRWAETGQTHLFAGMAVGWETGFYTAPAVDLANPPTADGQTFEAGEQVRTGYAALSARGENEASIAREARQRGVTTERALFERMADVLHDYTEFLARTCHEAGIPSDRVYSHYAALETLLSPDLPTEAPPGEHPFRTTLRDHPALREELLLDGRMIPLDAAVNPYCRPGATVASCCCDLDRVVEVFEDAGRSAWGAVEIEITADMREADAIERYFERMTTRGARVICLYGWWEDADNPYCVRSTGAVEAIARWLCGAEASGEH